LETGSQKHSEIVISENNSLIIKSDCTGPSREAQDRISAQYFEGRVC
jgi:hypothetical protein